MTEREVILLQRKVIDKLKKENRMLKEKLLIVTEEQMLMDAEDRMVFALVNEPAKPISEGCICITINQ